MAVGLAAACAPHASERIGLSVRHRQEPPDCAAALVSEIRALRAQISALDGQQRCRDGCLLSEAGWDTQDALDVRDFVDQRR